MAQNLIIANATYSDVPAVDISKVGGGTARFVDTSDANATDADIAKNKIAYVNGQKIVGTNEGGGGGILITKTITENGTYDASDDNADGYSQVTVAIPFYDGSVINI